MSYTVSIVRCPEYRDPVVRAAVEAVVAPLGGMAAFVAPGQRVLIKLNLLNAREPERAVTTHPALVRAVVRLVQEAGATAIVGDSPAGINTAESFRALLEKTGIRQVIDETGCEWHNFDEATVDLAPKAARVFKKFFVVRAPLEADVVISLPKLKTHQFTYYTGAVKLLYGYLPGLTKVEHHLHAGKDVNTFAELLLDIYETFPPTLNLMDAVVAMEGAGPSNGTPRPVGLLLASTSAPALDFAAAHVIGLNPLVVPTVRAALRRGIGPGALDEITFPVEHPDNVRIPDFRQADTVASAAIPAWATGISGWLFATRPLIDPGKCIRCGKCADSCPPKAIAFAQGRLPRINHTPCLRCYCCHELCPAGAIRVGDPRVPFPLRVGARIIAVANAIRLLNKRRHE